MGWPDDGDLPVEVEAAFGADLTADPGSWSWTDLSGRLRAEPIRRRVGKSGGTAYTSPGTCTVTLDNDDAALTPLHPISPYWPNIKLGTPLRVRVQVDGVWHERFSGFADQWEPTYLPTGVVGQMASAVRITASGILRRVQQGTPVAESPLRRTIRGASPLAYWPVEDGTLAGQAGSVVSGGTPLTVSGQVEFRAVEDYVDLGYTVRFGTSALADLSAGGRLFASLPGSVTSSTATRWTVHVAAGGMDPATIAGNVVLLEWTTSGGTYLRWRLIAQKSPTRMQVWAYNAAGTGFLLSEYIGLLFGFAHYAVSAYQSGSNITVDFYPSSNDPDSFSTFTGPGTLAGLATIAANPTGATSTAEMPFGHVAVFATSAPPFDFAGSLDAQGYLVNAAWASWEGETATGRLARLAAEDGIALDMPPVAADSLTRMGAQAAGTALDLYRECEDAELGILYESGFGLGYLPRAYRYNKPVDLTIDLATYAVTGRPDVLSPILDDQGVRNEFTVSRRDGSSAVASDLDSQRQQGVYADSIELNLASDDQLADQAGWRLRLDDARPAWTPEERRRLSVHEAAHAVAAVVLGAPVAWSDLDWRPGVAGATMVRDVDPRTDAVVALAGYEASGYALIGLVDTHDTRAARSLVGDEGMAAATQAARRILIDHREKVLTVAAALVEHGRLTGDQVVDLVRSPIPAGRRASRLAACSASSASGTPSLTPSP